MLITDWVTMTDRRLIIAEVLSEIVDLLVEPRVIWVIRCTFRPMRTIYVQFDTIEIVVGIAMSNTV